MFFHNRFKTREAPSPSFAHAIVYNLSLLIIKEHIGDVVIMSVSGYIDRRFKPRLHLYFVSLSKTLYPY